MAARMVWLPSMATDICDAAKAETGERREGMYNAVLIRSLSFAISGPILLASEGPHLVLWDAVAKADQHPATFQAMHTASSTGTVSLAVLSALFLWNRRVMPDAVAAAQTSAGRRQTHT